MVISQFIFTYSGQDQSPSSWFFCSLPTLDFKLLEISTFNLHLKCDFCLQIPVEHARIKWSVHLYIVISESIRWIALKSFTLATCPFLKASATVTVGSQSLLLFFSSLSCYPSSFHWNTLKIFRPFFPIRIIEIIIISILNLHTVQCEMDSALVHGKY